MPDTNYIAVRYERNADERSTAAITFNDDDRQPIEIGGTGVVTQEEFNILNANGIILAPIEDQAEAKQVIADAQTPEPEPTLEDLNVSELRDLAEQEGVDLSGKSKKDDIVEAIVDNRQQTGEESLPATATRTPQTTITGPGAGGAAGPGGAGSEPGTSGGGPAT